MNIVHSRAFLLGPLLEFKILYVDALWDALYIRLYSGNLKLNIIIFRGLYGN